MDIRKIAIIFVIGALFAILAFSTIDAVVTDPRETYCNEQNYMYYAEKPLIAQADTCKPIQPTAEEQEHCVDNNGYFYYEYDANGCATSYRCSCSDGYPAAQARYELITFLLYSLFATIGVALGVFLPKQKNPLHEWIGTGFMLGGFVCLFIGTAKYFEEMDKIIRPIVILVELALIVYLAYKKLGDLKEETKKRK